VPSVATVFRRETTGVADDVVVSISFDPVPSGAGHRVVVRRAAGEVCWATGRGVPPSFRLPAGELLSVTASVPVAERPRSGMQETVEWHVRVRDGCRTALHLGPRGLARPMQGLGVQLEGAERA
jgi:hypothetical protein